MNSILYFSCTLLIVACYVSIADCAQAKLRSQQKPKEFADQEGCYIPKLNKVIPYEKPYSPQDGATCVQYTCAKDGETTLTSCGDAVAGVGCLLIPGDNDLPYPDCCEKVTCGDVKPVPAK